MSETTVETVFWAFAIILFGVVALFPKGFFRILGMGRVVPAASALTVLRVVAGFCILGLVYRLVWLYRR